ncbi:MAG: hypothetical protein GY832_30945 [Chloroflexi bacterium]|nr:hypothetical protein [Chloroflexota bacterium]
MSDNGNVTRDRTDRNTADIKDLRVDFETEQRRNADRAEETSRWRGEMNTKLDTLLDRTIRRRADSTKIAIAMIGASASIGVALIALLA